MSDFFKSKQKLTLALGAFFMAVTILAGSFAYLSNGMPVVADASEGQQQSIQDEEQGLEDTPPGSQEDWEENNWEAEDPAPVLNTPAVMNGVILTPGKDFLTEANGGAAEIGSAIAQVAELGLNTVIIDTSYKEGVIYTTSGAPTVSGSFDAMEAAVREARSLDLYVYAILDVSHYGEKQLAAPLSIGAGEIDTLGSNLEEFLQKYPVDGVLIDGYDNAKNDASYGIYSLLGGGIGFQSFLRQSPEAVVRSAARTIRSCGSVHVGLLAEAVWANEDENAAGSPTKASYTSLGSGNADTKGFVEKNLVDFVAVKAYGSLTDGEAPFGEVVTWWADVARSSDVQLYVVHAADKIASGETGWGTADQITKQLDTLEDVSGVRGSIFNSLDKISANPQIVPTVSSVYKPPAEKDTVEQEESSASAETESDKKEEHSSSTPEKQPELVLKELQMTKPEQTTFTTTEATVTFAGASDPTTSVLINDTAVAADSSGYFSVSRELKAGQNTFTIVHKSKSVTYNITRQVEILRDISPTGSITTEGGMSITISAYAYEAATVSATVNGAKVPMKVNDSVVDEVDRDSSYKLFTGQYTAPAAGTGEQKLGNIVVTATWNGESKSITGASVTVNKKAKIENGVPVVVVADQAKTYPYNTLDNVPNSNYYPLPKGAMDYAVGEEIVYKKDNKTYTYTVLASNMRVESKDIQAITNGDYPAGNVISGMNVTAEGGYTYVTLTTAQKVSYSFSYASSGVTIKFHNTTGVPESASLSSNPIFSKATWSGNDTLTLGLLQTGGFMGYKGYYDSNGNLVFRFNNPPSSLSSARIAIDPGHGGSDPGTAGFLSSHPEKVINRAIAEYLRDELEARGATVLLIDSSSNMELAERVERAESFEADLLVSIHNNSGSRAAAQGTETYYFYPYAKTLATYAASNVSSQLGTDNRGARSSYYHVTLSAQVPSVLVECGFMSNQEEYEKLVTDQYQKAIAVGIADSLASSIKAAYTGSGASGSQSVGNGNSPGGSTSTGGSTAAKDVALSSESLTIAVGKSKMLQATVAPSTATNQAVTWSSGNTAVVSVNSSGKITALSEGTAKITATTADGGHTATCTVTVVSAGSGYDADVSVEDIALDVDNVELDMGETKTVKVSVYPKNADDPTVTWKSSDTAVATVNASGVVTGVKTGRATITATTNDGGISTSCHVTVSSQGSYNGENSSANSGANTTGAPLSKAQWYDFDTGYVSLYIETSKQLEILNEDDEVINPADFTWKSSSNSVATVDQYGVVTAKKKVDAVTITATPKDDSMDIINCTVEVHKSKVAVTGVSLNQTSITVLQGTTYKDLKLTFTPSNATNTDVTWKSSNSKIAEVDSQGNITGRNQGVVTVTATSKDGKYKATVEVTVKKAAREIDYVDLSDYKLELYVGEEEYIEAYVYPDNANQNVTWTSSNPKVATVDSKGNITALAKGTTTIKAVSTQDSSCYEECKITVYE